MNTKDIGNKGENLTVEYLLSNDYEIIVRNYRYKRCEIDIICKKGDILVFVEVKIRNSNKYGYPENFVSISQQERIKTAAENFIIDNNWNKNIRFDISSIVKHQKSYKITYFKDAF